jgi:hypothetical protein
MRRSQRPTIHPHVPRHAGSPGRLNAVVAVLLAVASGSAAAQAEIDGTELARVERSGLRLMGNETSRLPRIDMALLSPLPSPVADPVRLARRAQGVAPDGPLNLGLHWRPQPVGGFTVHATVWRRISLDPQPSDAPPEAVYGAQVEMELRRDQRAALRDLLGMKLDNGGRISLKPRKNAVTVYYKVSF